MAYDEIIKQNNTGDSVKNNCETFQSHKSALDKGLKYFAEASKQKITLQPCKLSGLVKAA